MKLLTILTACSLAVGPMFVVPSLVTEAKASGISISSKTTGQSLSARVAKKKPANVNGFKAAERRLLDTCKGGDQACIDELIANCDKANGGLSTEPDGGVDCYVVGIHDQ